MPTSESNPNRASIGYTKAQIHDKLILPRTISLGMMFVLAGVTFGFGLVVYYALEGTPLMGNFITVLGEPILAIVAAVLFPEIVATAILVGARRRRQSYEALVKEHPEVIDPESDSERIVAAFATGRFYEYGILWGYGLACAILFHLLVSAVLPVLIGLVILVMIVRFPYTFAAVPWYRVLWQQLDQDRQQFKNLPRPSQT